MHADAHFTIQSWDEKPFAELEGGGKLTRAKVAQAFTGDLEGEGAVEYLMAYRPDGTADYVGLLRFTGRLSGRAGSLVMRLTGSFDGALARTELEVVPGAGTGALARVTGRATFVAGKDAVPFSFDYALG
jgi:hypothetical protein